MSAQKTYSIRCPQCRFEQTAELYESIHVSQQPDLKAALFENRLNRIECRDCKASFRVDKPLLYHDSDRNILIHWIPETSVGRDEILDEFDRTMEELRAALPEDLEPPRVRLVFTRTELVELLFIMEAGMEERVVEFIKYTIYTRNVQRVPPSEKNLLLNIQDSTPEELLFAVQDTATFELEEVLRYPRESYRRIRDTYRRDPSELTDLFPGPYINARRTLLEEGVSL